jgi:hypothetical protein
MCFFCPILFSDQLLQELNSSEGTAFLLSVGSAVRHQDATVSYFIALDFQHQPWDLCVKKLPFLS